MAKLKIYRDNTEIIEVSIGDDTIRESYFMGDDRVRVSFSYPEIIDFLPYDYIIHNGKKYSIKGNEMPTRKEFGKRSFEYDIVFKAPEYRMHDMPLSHLGESKFSYFGTPSEMLNLVIGCMSVIDNSFVLDINEPVDIEPKLIFFDNVTCRQAVTQVCELFELEYNFDGHVLYVGKSIGNRLEGFTFSQGKGKGLYTLTEVSVPDSPFATRFYGFGGNENLPLDYKQGRKNLVMTGDYVERNVNLYGLIVQNIYFDDIYPTRTGTLTAVSSDFLTLTDTSIDFDLNDQQIEEAKIVFVSGELGGQEFEIASYNHSTKAIRINRKEESENYFLPNDTFSPKVGDKYKLVGIIMPESYITAAENKVAEKTLEYAEKHSHPSVGFELELDELELRRRGLVGALNVGTWIHVVSEKLGVDRYLRITELSYPIANPSKITSRIADVVRYTLAERILKDVSGNNKEIASIEREQKRNFSILSRKSAEQARLQAEKLTELREYIFDADNYFDSTKIKPLSIETQMLSVGAKSQNFYLSGVTMQPNYLGDANRFYVSAGQLQHREISIDAGYIWNLSAQAFYGLEPNKTYYLSARCSKSNLTGTYSLTDTPQTVESQAGFYHFNIGVLYPIGADGSRFFANTSGVSYVVGSQITTGRVKSLDGNTWFDLDTGEIRGKIKFTSGQTVESAIEQAKGEAVAQSGVDTQQAIAALSVGSRNILLKSDIDLIKDGGSNYLIGSYNISDSSKPLEIGKEYTLVVKAKHEGQGAIGIWLSGYQHITNGDDTYFGNETATKVYRFTVLDMPDPNWRSSINFYNVPAGSYPDFCIIYWAVLYEGNITNPPLDWTPSPEDFRQQIIDTDNARKAYIDAQDNLKETQTRAYADGIVSAEEARAIADATAKANAAKTYADAQDLLLKAQTDAYADGKVSAEESARIAQAQANLIAAQNYATAQDNLAKIEIKAYADGIVDAEEARAIADAQTKLNEAKLYAEEKQVEANGYALNLVSKISVGGRNFLRNSAIMAVYANNQGTGTISTLDGWGLATPNADRTVSLYGYYTGELTTPLLKDGTEYTFSIDLKAENQNTGVMYLIDGSGSAYNHLSFVLLPNKSTRLSISFKPSTFIGNDIGIILVLSGALGDRLFFRNFKIEKGNKATDWTPAPEDLQQQVIDTDNARKAYIDAQDNLKETQTRAYADGIVLAEEARAIADATAKANAAKSYADAQDLLLKAQTDAYADGKVTAEEQARISQAQSNLESAKAYAEAQDNLSKIETKAYADGIVDAEEQRAIADAQSKLNEAKSHADTQASQAQANAIATSNQNTSNALKALSIGGRNYYSNRFTELVPLAGAYDLSKNTSINGFIVTGHPSSEGVARIANVIDSNGDWVISGWFRGTQNVQIGFNIDFCDRNISPRIYSTNDNTWTYFEYTSNVDNHSPDVYNFVDLGGLGHVYYQFKNINIQKSNKATDWMPSVEDLEQQIIDTDDARKAYIDAQDNLKETEVKAYADGKVGAEEARAIADATAKANSAKAYADAQDLLLKAQTDAYADGKVSVEESARIAQAQANLTAAQNYATAQDNLAKIETKAYADGIVDAEEARAIADAQTKLNEAKNHADAQASQAQANAINVAQSNIQQEIGALSVGARNLILKSDVPSVKNGGSNYIFGFYNVSPKNSPLKVGQTYTLVVKAKHEGQGGIGIWIDGYQSIDGMGGYAWQNEEAVKVFRFVVEDTPASRTQIHFYNVPGGSYPDFCRVEWLVMYEGNITKPSLDWTPAPEDVQQQIIDADNAQKAYIDAQDNLKEIQVKAYADGVVDAEEARAIADAQAKLNEAKSHAEAQASQAQVNAISLSNQNITNAIKALSIGGRNYYRQSLPHSLSGGATGLAFNSDGANTMFLVGSPNGNGHLRINNVVNSSGSWVVSGYFRSAQNYLNPLQVDICDSNNTLFYAEPNNKWTYFEVAYNVPPSLYGDGSVYNFVDFENLGHLYYYFKNIKVEKGSKATDWTPAPEDLQQMVVDMDNAQKSYIDSQDALKEVQTKAYADGIVSAEEARAIADATAKANAAKSYADNLKVQTDNYVNSITTPIKNKVDDWTYADTLEIDGTKLKAGTVTADKIDTLNLVARHIATSSNVNKLTINDNNDNSIKIRHPNGQVGIQMGLVGGVPKLVFFNEYGNKVWEGGMSGIVYVDNVPESWSPTIFKLLPGNHSNVVPDVNGNITSNEKAQLKNWINTSSGFLTTDFGGAPVISSGTTFYSYSAGINAQAENNRVYEGLHTSQIKSTGNWMPNGWYGQSGVALYQVSDYPTPVYSINLEYYANGRMVASVVIDDITMI